MPTIPLRYRLPNAPVEFVGRQHELKAVAEGLRDSQVTLLAGPGGVGKSALALTCLHRRFPKRVSRALYVSLPRQVDDLEARQELLRALATSTGTDIGWSHLQDDADALLEGVLDLAEEHAFWIVVEDLHHLPPEDGDALLSQLSRYARTSRYLFTSRRAARPEAGHSWRLVEVSGLDEDAALSLARHLAKSRPPDALADAVRSSGGSPWLLREALLAKARSEQSVAGGELGPLFEGLEQPVRSFARLAALLELPVSASDLADATGIPESSWRAPLEARGWLEEGPAGVRLHEVASLGIMQSEQLRATPELWLPMARHLAQHAATPVRLDAVRLLIEGGDLDSAEEVLDRELSAFLADGYAPKLWKLLSQVPEDRLSGTRLRCAAELGSPTVLRQVPRPLGARSRDRLTWAETQYMKGDLAGALDALRDLDAVVDDAEEDGPDVRFDAELLRCRILIAQDDVSQAMRLLSELVPRSEDDATRRDAILASVTPLDPARNAETLVELALLERRCTALGGRDRTLSRFHVALSYFRARHFDRAEAALGALVSAEALDTLALFETRRAAWLHATIDVARGRLDAAQQRLELLEPFLHAPSLIRADVFLTRARLWMARGEFAELGELIGGAKRDAQALGLRAALRRTDRLLARSEALLLTGEGGKARLELELPSSQAAEARLEEIARILRRTHETGELTLATEHRAEACSLWLVTRRAPEFERELLALRAAARQMGSLRFAAEADLLGMVREVDLARLEAIAAHPELSPVASRRAQALLGAECPLDALDRAVVSSVAMPTLLLAVPPPPGAPRQAGWGIDLSTRRVWLPSGEWIDLSRRGLHLRLLMTLARHGGAATKEVIVREVWDERDYHPLRHDSRLQVTVHKLRDLLEDDPKSPVRVVTTVGGYGVAGPFRTVPEK